MAKLLKSGIRYQCLDEREVTLAEIVASLGLKPLSKKKEREIRNRLGFALAMWDEPYTMLQTKDVAGSLKAHAKKLDQVASLGAITRMSFGREYEIVVGGQLVQILASNPAIGTVEAAHEYLRNFCDRASIIASSCRAAAASMQSRKGRGGRSPHGWYDEFTAVLLDICKHNKTQPTVGLHRISGEPTGTLPKIAVALERLLPTRMRSRKPATIVKRLQRSMQRLEQQRLPDVSGLFHQSRKSCRTKSSSRK
jgi:hypothetical protein